MNAKVGIKSSYGSQEHVIHLEVPLDTKVSVLKQQIQDEHVGSPPVTAQRLIYCGKIIDNDDTLEQILSKMDLDVEQRFHLILSKDFTDRLPKQEPKVETVRVLFFVNGDHVVRLNLPLRSKIMEAKILLKTQLPDITDLYWTFKQVGDEKEARDDILLNEFLPITDLTREYTVIVTTGKFTRLVSTDTASSGSSIDSSTVDTQSSWNTASFQHQQMVFQQQQVAYYYYQQALLANPEWAQHQDAQMQAYQAQMALYMSMYPPAPVERPTEQPIPAPATTAPAPAAVVPPRPSFFNRWGQYLDVKLAVRLFMAVLILGQDSSPEKFQVLVASALLIYFYLTGLLTQMFNALRPYVARSTPRQQQAPNNQPTPPPAATTHTRGYAPITADGGLGKDIQYFVSGFFLSLLPTWSPTGQAM